MIESYFWGDRFLKQKLLKGQKLTVRKPFLQLFPFFQKHKLRPWEVQGFVQYSSTTDGGNATRKLILFSQSSVVLILSMTSHVRTDWEWPKSLRNIASSQFWIRNS